MPIRDDESIEIPSGSKAQALAQLQPLLGRLETDAAHYAAELPESTGELAAGAIDVWDDGDGEVNFVQALVLERLLAGRLERVDVDADIEVDQAESAQVIIRHGSLRVSGNLFLHAPLMVLGDLEVGGRVADLVKASRLVVAGNLSCKTMRIGSPVWVGGDVDCIAVCFDPGGKLWVGGELRAKVVVGSVQSGGVTAGKLNARFHSPPSDWERPGPGALYALERVLVPEAFRRADRERGYFQPDDLLQLIEVGRPFLRETR